MDDPGNRAGRTGAFHLRLGETPVLDQIREATHKFPDPDGDPVEVGNPLQKHCSGQYAAEHDEPHQRTALLHIVDHAEFIWRDRDGWQDPRYPLEKGPAFAPREVDRSLQVVCDTRISFDPPPPIWLNTTKAGYEG